MLFAGLRSVRIVKNGDLALENAALGHSFSPYGPPSGQITLCNTQNNVTYNYSTKHSVNDCQFVSAFLLL